MRRAGVLALLACLASGHAAAQEFGRLFFTPEQRAALDARRKARVPDKPAAVVVASPTTRLNGYVKRSGGPSTVFLNGEAQPDNLPESPRIAAEGEDTRVVVPLGESGSSVALKPGEVLDRGNGEIRDAVGDGEIRVRRTKPAK